MGAGRWSASVKTGKVRAFNFWTSLFNFPCVSTHFTAELSAGDRHRRSDTSIANAAVLGFRMVRLVRMDLCVEESTKEASMFNNRIDMRLPLSVIEVLARITSVASIALLVMLFLGEGVNPSAITRNEWIGLFFFPIGVILGMVIAWWKEGLGAVIAVGSLAGFYLVWGYLLKNHIGGWAFITFASPGFLFLLHWLVRGAERRHVFG
jgi:hypothetical protein